MEYPYGCGDMEQLVSITNIIAIEPDEPAQGLVQVIYERCRECGHEENIDVIVTKEENQNKQEIEHE